MHSSLPFRIKICGITSVQDACAAVEAGADAIGINFYAQSPRGIDVATAEELVRSLPRHVVKVGVFVNECSQRVIEIADRLQLEYIQLHGEEPPRQLAELAPRPVIRAFRLSTSHDPVLTYLAACTQEDCAPAAILVDAWEPDRYGGTGRIANWEVVRCAREQVGTMPVVLAGGLCPENIAQALAQVRPAAVDVASGVEVAPGRKDAGRMRSFVEAALRAWPEARPQ